MIPYEEDIGLRELLGFMSTEDLMTAAEKRNLAGVSLEEKPRKVLIDVIMSNAQSPEELLHFKWVKKYAILRYLRNNGHQISDDWFMEKLIEECLKYWSWKTETDLRNPPFGDYAENMKKHLAQEKHRAIELKKKGCSLQLKNEEDKLNGQLERDITNIKNQYREQQRILEGRLENVRTGGNR